MKRGEQQGDVSKSTKEMEHVPGIELSLDMRVTRREGGGTLVECIPWNDETIAEEPMFVFARPNIMSDEVKKKLLERGIPVEFINNYERESEEYLKKMRAIFEAIETGIEVESSGSSGGWGSVADAEKDYQKAMENICPELVKMVWDAYEQFKARRDIEIRERREGRKLSNEVDLSRVGLDSLNFQKFKEVLETTIANLKGFWESRNLRLDLRGARANLEEKGKLTIWIETYFTDGENRGDTGSPLTLKIPAGDWKLDDNSLKKIVQLF